MNVGIKISKGLSKFNFDNSNTNTSNQDYDCRKSMSNRDNKGSKRKNVEYEFRSSAHEKHRKRSRGDEGFNKRESIRDDHGAKRIRNETIHRYKDDKNHDRSTHTGRYKRNHSHNLDFNSGRHSINEYDSSRSKSRQDRGSGRSTSNLNHMSERYNSRSDRDERRPKY